MTSAEFISLVKTVKKLLKSPSYDIDAPDIRATVLSAFIHHPYNKGDKTRQTQLLKCLDLKTAVIVFAHTTYRPTNSWDVVLPTLLQDIRNKRTCTIPLTPSESLTSSSSEYSHYNFFLTYRIPLLAADIKALVSSSGYFKLLNTSPLNLALAFALPNPLNYTYSTPANRYLYHRHLLYFFASTTFLSDFSNYSPEAQAACLQLLDKATKSLDSLPQPNKNKLLPHVTRAICNHWIHNVSDEIAVQLKNETSYLTVLPSSCTTLDFDFKKSRKRNSAQMWLKTYLLHSFISLLQNTDPKLRLDVNPLVLEEAHVKLNPDLKRQLESFSTGLNKSITYFTKLFLSAEMPTDKTDHPHHRFLHNCVSDISYYSGEEFKFMMTSLSHSTKASSLHSFLSTSSGNLMNPFSVSYMGPNEAAKLLALEPLLLEWLGEKPPLDHGVTIKMFYKIYAIIHPQQKAEAKLLLAKVLSRYAGRMAGFPADLAKEVISAGSTHHDLAYFEGLIAGITTP